MTENFVSTAARPWRAQEKTADGTTVEDSGTGLFDELAIEDFLHLEWLDDRTWFIQVGDAGITATILDKGGVEVTVVRGAYTDICGETEVWAEKCSCALSPPPPR
ncbi:MAG: hypothetical protein ACRBN8_08150 [Nannocystales bacterium]